jgi:DNA helicase-2/ATP-dependent DNA helicase PcrA
LIDFEDLLECTIQMFDRDEVALEEFREGYRAFTVDEYQDVNLLQETLLRTWLGERDQLCVVGDDYQSIYGFTGATPRYLLEMPQRFVGTKVIRLEDNYRSTPQVLSIANRLTPRLGGAEKLLRATRPGGPESKLRAFTSPAAEINSLIARIRDLHAQGLPYEEMAILYRLNFRSEDYEEALAAAAIPYQVRDGAFLTRQTARQMLASLRKKASTSVAQEVEKLARGAGYVEDPSESLGEREITRQNDLARFIRLAEEFDDGARTSAQFVADIEGRFGTDGGRGVNLLTYHRAKGLEFEAVFLPQLQDGELPFRRSKSDEAIAEERRLFYVGITRAKTHLVISWVNDGRRKGSMFVGELRDPAGSAGGGLSRPPRREETIVAHIGMSVQLSGGFSGEIIEMDESEVTVALEGGVQRTVAFGERVTVEGKTAALEPGAPAASPAFDALKRWRRERSVADNVPAFVVFHDSTLEEIVERRPATLPELAALPGIGPTKLERYGADVLKVLQESIGAPAD